jgi:hypothetical protein
MELEADGAAPEGSAPALVLLAAAPWGRATHRLFPTEARAYAMRLLLLGHNLSRQLELTAAAQQGMLDPWVDNIMPRLVVREYRDGSSDAGDRSKGDGSKGGSGSGGHDRTGGSSTSKDGGGKGGDGKDGEPAPVRDEASESTPALLRAEASESTTQSSSQQNRMTEPPMIAEAVTGISVVPDCSMLMVNDEGPLPRCSGAGNATPAS